ncbi:uncharacterized protein LOC6551704 isoform X2 [Drosophila erecta]|uniref:Uncharacterized protein, isoform B n=1 Tax=Drosophila erecta TaxID=7220 RepID=A0A0Q5TJ26_DROER|nr:uncharacterized protein LOC6551704 isoform X2 [Drosophila erecta]KQS29882.1 uncharacterized protein Dere_GG18951, isoform B [Drosophila erecta]
MQFTRSHLLISMAVLSALLSVTLGFPAPQQTNSELEARFQDTSDPDLNPINAETKRRRRAGGKDLSDAAEIMGDASLELPSELLNKSLVTVTNISKSLSRLILNSARRYSRFVLFFKPVFGDALVVKGSEDPTTTTTVRTTTTTQEIDKLNEV